MKNSRFQVFVLAVFCTLLAPLLMFLQLGQALIGSKERAYAMAVAFDQMGNCLFGGQPNMTISTRVGNALKQGEPWAKPAAAFIDALFGKGHCLANATV
jgi:hypothetical protein